MSTHAQFEQIVQDHQQMVFRTLARLTGRTDDLEDLAQSVFLRLFRALPAFRGDALIATYLYRITVNIAQDEWKRRQRIDRRTVSLSAPLHSDEETCASWEDRLPHPALNPQQELEQRELQLLVDEQLNQLSTVERSILVLYHQEERTYLQIAEILRLPIGTVRTHLHRGRNKLKAAIARPKEARV